MSDKPKSSVCNKCFVKRNRLRCALCVHKTSEWLCQNPSIIIADFDCFKEKEIKEKTPNA